MNSITIPQFFKDFTGSIEDFRLLLENLANGTADHKYGETPEEQQRFLQEIHHGFTGIHSTNSENSLNPRDIGEWFYYNKRFYHTGGVGVQGVQGIQGIQGIQGTQGTQGNRGTQGTQGNVGINGIRGTMTFDYNGTVEPTTILNPDGTAIVGGGSEPERVVVLPEGIESLIPGDMVIDDKSILYIRNIHGELTPITGLQGTQGPAGGGSDNDNDTKNTVGNHEVQGQVLIVVGVQGTQGSSAEDYATSYAHEEYIMSDEELERVAIAELGEDATQEQIAEKIEELRSSLGNGNTAAEGFNDKKDTIETLNDNNSLNPYVHPHTMEGLVPDNGSNSSFTTLVSEYEKTNGQPLTPHIGEDGWFYIGKHRVIVDSDLNALWDIINNKFNPDKWPSPAASVTNFPNPSASATINNTPSIASSFNYIDVSTNPRTIVNISSGGLYELKKDPYKLVVRTDINVSPKSTLTASPNSTVFVQGVINGMNVDNTQPPTGYKRTLTGETIHESVIYTTNKSVTPQITTVVKDQTADTWLKLFFNGNSIPDDPVMTVFGDVGVNTLKISADSPIGDVKHGENIISIKYHNPSSISLTGGTVTVDAIAPVFYCSKKGNVLASKTIGLNQTNRTLANASAAITSDKTSTVNFYGVYPIYCNSLYKSGNCFKTSQYSKNDFTPDKNVDKSNSGHIDANDNVRSFDSSKYLWNYITGNQITLYIVLGVIKSAAIEDTGARIYLPANSITGYNLRVTQVIGLDTFNNAYDVSNLTMDVQQDNMVTLNGLDYKPYKIFYNSSSVPGINAYKVIISR
jgi:hypothetical protein